MIVVLFVVSLLVVLMLSIVLSQNRMSDIIYRRFPNNRQVCRFIVLLLLFILFLFHYLYFSYIRDISKVFLSTLFTLCMFSGNMTECIFKMFNVRKVRFGLFIIMLILVFMEKYYTLAVTLYLIMGVSFIFSSLNEKRFVMKNDNMNARSGPL